MILHRDKIAALHGSWSSGLATMVFESGRSIYCENAPTVRALDAATEGNAIGPGHTINAEGVAGLDIVYAMEDWGVLAGFVLVSESPELAVIPLGGSANVEDAPEGGLKIEVIQ